MDFEQRMKENVRKYTLAMLLGEKQLQMFFDSLTELMKIDLLLLDRLGAEVLASGDLRWKDINIDNDPGRTLIVLGRTMGHLYARKQMDNTQEEIMEYAGSVHNVSAEGSALTLDEEAFLDASLKILERLALQTYLQKETICYIDERENRELPGKNIRNLEKQDGLTGVYNKGYFENRVQVIERAEVVPVAVIIANINDWKYVHDNYSEDESDRLIQIISAILKEEAKSEYVIGRIDGDVFQILIPMAEDGEAESYMERVQSRCSNYEDDKLAPSVAMGIEYKTNIEESIAEKASDAEYAMFQNKIDLKNAAGYAERLGKGLKK